MKLILYISVAGLAFGQTLPDGPGKAVTERMCSGCHGLENVVRAKRTKEKWAEVVDDMVSRGAKGTDAEIDQVIEYLATHFGPNATVGKVNVNKASAAELVSALEISTPDAESIVRYRTDKGAFKSVQDLARVPGMDAKKTEGFQDRIEF
jgi:competence protein ComEA